MMATLHGLLSRGELLAAVQGALVPGTPLCPQHSAVEQHTLASGRRPAADRPRPYPGTTTVYV